MRLTPEIEMLERAAEALGPLSDEMIYVGGSVVGLLLTDPAAPNPRPTQDVDVVVEAASRVAYYAIEQRMRERGFRQEPEVPVICRWFGHGLTIDVMASGEDVLGFSNPWYGSAFRNPIVVRLPAGPMIRVIDGPHFLATKLAAFSDRGKGDVYASHDLEDIVGLVDGRPELVGEVTRTAAALAAYVADQLRTLLSMPAIEEAVEGHLGAYGNTRGRLPILMTRLGEIAR